MPVIRFASLTRFSALLLTIAALAATSAPLVASRDAVSKLDPILQTRAMVGSGQSRIIIRMESLASAKPLELLIQGSGGTVHRRLAGINAQVAVVPDAALRGLAANPLVLHISLDRPIVGAMERTGTTIGASAIRQELGYTGSGVGIALVDSGVTSWHDDLVDPSGAPRVEQFVDFVNGADQPYDDYGHGTHVAGIVSGNGVDSGGARTGIAPAARLVVLKVLDASGHGRISDVIAAIDHAIAQRDALNIRVINLSVASGVYESVASDPLALATKRAVEAGIVVVAASGNNGISPEGRVRYRGVTSPGNAPWVLTVGGSSHMGTVTRSDDVIAPFSSRGPTAIDHGAKPDLVAPSVGIESLSAPGSTLSAMWSSFLLNGTVASAHPPYLSLTGTSMAAPVVAGTVALMLEANPALTPNAVKAVLQYTAQLRPDYDPLTQGAGFLNAKNAVVLARFLAAPPGTAHPETSGWSRRILWGNYAVRNGRLTSSANAWAHDVTWGASTTPSGEGIVWGLACSTPTCDVQSAPWTLAVAKPRNVVWGSVCGGADCTNSWTLSAVSGDTDTVVWGTTDTGDTVVWGTFSEAETVVWGTATSGDTVVWGTTDGADTVVWGTSCLATSCVPTIWR